MVHIISILGLNYGSYGPYIGQHRRKNGSYDPNIAQHRSKYGSYNPYIAHHRRNYGLYDPNIAQHRKKDRRFENPKFSRQFKILKMTQQSFSIYPKIPKSDLSKFIDFSIKIVKNLFFFDEILDFRFFRQLLARTMHYFSYVDLYMDRTIHNSVLKLILYGPRFRINQSWPGNIGSWGLQHSL